jgi:hypothetical protein
MNPNHHFELGHVETKYDKYVPWGIADVIFTYFFVFFLSLIFLGFMVYVSLDVNMALFGFIFQMLVSGSTLTVIYLIVTKKYNLSFIEAFGIDFEKTLFYAKQGIYVTLIIVALTTFISFIFTWITGLPNINPYMDMSREKLKLITILALFFAPAVEEIFFRGFIQPAISKKIGPFGGILITGVIFGLAHSQYLDYGVAVISIITIGIILGITKYLTGFVMPGIFAHFFNNLLAVINLN